jgi:hypothetical protein
MTIKNEKELTLFESTIDSCKDQVLLVTSTGKQYNLKNPMEYHTGMSILLDETDPEIYTYSREDMNRLYHYFEKVRAA